MLELILAETAHAIAHDWLPSLVQHFGRINLSMGALEEQECTEAIKTELNAYMQDEGVNAYYFLSDPGVYWKEKQVQWPPLYFFAAQQLASPPCSLRESSALLA